MAQIRSGWRRLTCQTLALAMILLGLTVVATPPAHAAADAVVSGTVVDSVTQQPLASVTVADSTSGRSATTAAQGTYSLSVPAGDHVLTATLAGYVPSSTPKLTLTAGQTLSSQGFTMVQYASASGVVTEKGTSTGIAAVVVKFFDASTSDPNPLFAATTGLDGSWSIAHVSPGSYKVEFDGTATDFLDRWYPSKGIRADATAVTVNAGESKIISDSLTQRPTIKGHVAISNGSSSQPGAGATVTATSPSGLTKSVVTDGSGDYLISGLSDGMYQVRISHPANVTRWLQAVNADSFPISLLAGAVLDLGTTYLPAGSTITGTVHLRPGVTAVVQAGGVRTTTAADGTFTLKDVDEDFYVTVAVYAFGYWPLSLDYALSRGQTLTLDLVPSASAQPPAAATGNITNTSGAAIAGATVADASKLASVTTSASGSFSLPRVDPTNIVFRISAPGYVTRDISFSDPTSLGTIVLAHAASLTGHVTFGPGGPPAAGVSVEVGKSDTGGDLVYTDSDGRYAVSDLAPGYYKVSATALAGPDSLTSYLGGAVSRALATYISIEEGAVLTGRDITIAAPARLSGVVRRQGIPVAGQTVGLIGMGADLNAKTGADGTFLLTGIEPGTYRLGAGWGDEVTWWNGASEIGGATDIALSSGDSLTDYVLDLVVLPTLSGTLRTPGGTALPYTQVAVRNGSWKWTTTSDQSGLYHFTLPTGSYELGSVLLGNVNWSAGAASPDIFTVAGHVVKDFTVPDTLTLTLKVKGSDGSTPYSFYATAYNSHGEAFAGGGSSSGTAAISIQPGTFRITVFSLHYLSWSTQLTVTASSELSVILDVGGTIAGSTPVNFGIVTAINAVTGQQFSSSGMGSYKTYTISPLPPGDYVLSAVPYEQNSPCGPAQWYDGSSYLTARRVHVDSGTSLTGFDFSLSCEQFWSADGEVLGDIAMPPSAPASAFGDVVISATNSVGTLTIVPSGDGAFDVTMIPGTYEITAYQNALGLEGHATVTVDGDSIQFVTLTMTKRGLVTGKVVGPLGEPVLASLSDGETEAQTDSQGNFSLGGISYGTHTLKVVPQNSLYALTFFDVTVGAGSDVVGVTIHAPLSGRMFGLLAGSAGTVQVTVFDASSRVVASMNFMWSIDLVGLPPGSLKVRFAGPAIITEWWRDATDQASATPIQMAAGGGVTDVTPNLRPAAPGENLSSISGKVTYAAAPLGGVTLSTTVGSQTVTATTASDGTYSLAVTRGDTYTVKAEVCIGAATYPCAGQHFVDARDVVADSAAIPGVDFLVPLPANSFTVAPQPVVSGRAATGQTLTATVADWSPMPDSTSWQWYADGLAIYGATATTVTVTDAQIGKVVQVVVTRSKAGYTTLTLPSVPMLVEVPGAIRALTPSRLLDSRTGLGGFTGPAKNGTVIKLPVVGGTSRVPTDASAVLVNLTVTAPTASGYVTAYASGGTAPWVSNANFTPGVTVANLSLVPVGADGAIALKVATPGSVHVIADVQGYVVGGTVVAAGAVKTVTPARVLDTRTTQHVGTGGTISLTVAGVVGVPADASAVVANITVTGTTGAGYLTAWPAGVARPTSSNVNFVTGQTVPNMAIVKVGANKSISLFNSSGPMDVVVDIQGYVIAGTATLPGTVVPVTPSRMVDTRLDLGAYGPVPANSGQMVDFVADGMTAIPQGALINLTVTEPRASGWLAAYPYGVARPVVSNLNFTPGAVVPNLALATLGDGYGVLYNGSGGTVQMVADVLAYVL